MKALNSRPRPFNKSSKDSKVLYQISLPTEKRNTQIWYNTKKYDNPISAYYENWNMA